MKRVTHKRHPSGLSSLSRPLSLGIISGLALLSFVPSSAHAALNIPITVNLSEAVNVTGTPRIAVDVGGTSRYATYTSGTGTNALTFTLSPQAGDVDLDGVTVSSPIDLNGGTIKDTKGNALASLAFTPPVTTNVKVNYPSLGMDFVYDADGRYTLNGTAYNDLSSFLSAAGGSFTRASIGTYFDSAGVMQTAASGAPRFDYDPVTHTAKGILIEESRINKLTYSDQFDNVIWLKNALTIIANSVSAPDGTMTADKVQENSANTTHFVLQDSSITNGATYTQTIYAKADTRSFLQISSSGGFDLTNTWANFNLSTGTIGNKGSAGTASISSIGNGWYRCSLTATATSGTSAGRFAIGIIDSDRNARLPFYTGDGISSIYIWGAQLEQGSFPSSYIPTTTATVTRSIDNLSLPSGAWTDTTKGTFYLKASKAANQGVPSRYYAFINGNAQVSLTNSGNIGGYITDSGGAIMANFNGPSITTGTTFKDSLVYNTNDFAESVNGASLLTDSSGTVSTLSTLVIGNNFNSGTRNINSTIQTLKYYPTRVPDAQLQLLSQ